ncbi:single-stranded-DNA-specific exonuclease RecJ [Bacillus sp. FJAT-45350]|uniref:single-stranded-DNA-specific exonuclease RecJ n=1 Tax=Bacillus sp. FJAT-45350 TaxID=2011014 RepID=UPI000BB6960A|nr:single-stranded-DNA-specific exonuclease RecJ [Bacillus sp. FJAT-45350]
MLKPKARWRVQQSNEEKVVELTEGLQLSPLVAKLLLNRGINSIEEARTFLEIEKTGYHDPFLLDGMKEAVERIEQSIATQEKILIFGDYDADGVSSTSVLIYTMKQLGADFQYYIPNRFTEGYGPNEPALRWAKEEGFNLVVTVDTGISAVHEASVAKEIGLDFIVTDHHEAPPVLPDAYAIVNPKKPNCPYPFKGLAGVGVAFKLAHALLGKPPEELLDIVAIGTIADLVPLVDENRLFAKKGVQALHLSTKPGIRALKKICGIDGQLNEEHVGFAIGPRINAAGRLDSADPAVELLTTESIEEAEEIAALIDDLNKSRQGLVNKMAEEAIQEVEEYYPPDKNNVLIIAKEGWNAGVIGIVASRLVERYYRPTIVMSIDSEKGLAKGSARSIEGFDMFENLSESRDILPHFGGHPMAAGLTMKLEHIEELRIRLNRQADEKLTEEDFIPIQKVDLVTPIEEVSIDVIEQMGKLAPFGVSNPTPKVLIEKVGLNQIRRIGSDENHLKVAFEQDGSLLDGIGFHLGYLFEEVTSIAKVSAIGKLSINEWNGHCKPQLMIEDVGVDEWQLFDWRNVQRIHERLELLPKEKRVIIAFHEESIDQLMLQVYKDEILIINGDEGYPNLDIEDRYLVLLDLPDAASGLESLLEYDRKPERIYTVFYQNESHFFSTAPTRENFKWYYGFLKKKGSFNIDQFGHQLAKHKGWSKNTVDFMTKVFFELDFVRIENGLITLNEKPEKKDLVDSKTYRRKSEQSNLENEFVYSSYQQLQQWFERVLTKEKIKET